MHKQYSLEPGNGLAHYKQGVTLLKLQQSCQAAEEFRQALSLEPGLADAHYQLGKLAAASGQMSQAVASLTKATELDPQHLEAHYQLGLAYQKLGERANATAALRKFEQLKAAKTDPAQTQDAEDLAVARRHVLQAPEVGRGRTSSRPARSPGRERSATAIAAWPAADRKRESARSFEAAGSSPASSFSQVLPWRLGWGATYLQLQRPAEAAASFQEAIRLKPDARAYFYLGKAYAELKDARSVEALRAAVTHDADSEDAWELLGLQAFEHKALPSVIPLFQQQAQRSPAQPLAHLWLGEAYLRNQDLPQALQSFKKAVELSPQLARAQFSLGFAYKELGENTLAVEALRRAASLAPENPLTHLPSG